MAKRILVISQRYWPENTKINDICEGLAEDGLRVDVLCGQPNFPAGRFYKGYSTFGRRKGRHGGVNIFRTMEIRRDTGSSFRIMLNYLAFPFAGFFRAFALRKNSYDAVFVYQNSSVMADRAGLMVARKQHIPVITYAVNIWPQYFYHELDIQNTLLKKMFARISARHYLAADRIITQSREASDHFTSSLHIHPSKVSCVPPGQDKRFDNEVRDMAVMERYAGSFNILITDEMLNAQDYRTIFNTGKLIVNAGAGDIRIIVCGSGKRITSLKKRADKLGLHDLIFFEDVSEADEIPKYFFVASAFLSCAKVESGAELSFPPMFADYMSQGKPIMATTGSLEKRLIRDAECGMVCDPKDPEGLFAMIMKMYRSPLDDIRKMGENAKAYHLRYFDRDTNIRLIEEIIFHADDDTDDGFIINQNTNIIRTEDI